MPLDRQKPILNRFYAFVISFYFSHIIAISRRILSVIQIKGIIISVYITICISIFIYMKKPLK